MERRLESKADMELEKTVDPDERRRHCRFKATTGVFAVNAKFGQIIDIGRGGLSFRYVERRGWPKELFEMGVIYGDDDFCLDNLPIKTIADCVIANGLGSYSTIIRRCGVQFGELDAKQAGELEYFILANSEVESGRLVQE